MTPKTYINFIFHIPEEHYDMCYGIMSQYPIIGITEGLDALTLCMLADDVSSTFADDLLKEFQDTDIPAVLHSQETIIEENWNKSWEDSIEPIVIPGIMAIIPSWRILEPLTDPTLPRIIIDPQMSFGTGHHETTRLCLQLLKTAVQPDSHWIDAGTGTGVLGLGALLFGAKTVYAFDFDEWCVLNTAENIERNGDLAQGRMIIEQANVITHSFSRAHGICANLHRNILYECGEKFFLALSGSHGTLIVSGLLWMDEDEVHEYFVRHGFEHQRTIRENDWIAMQFQAHVTLAATE